ncbi:uncharacterized protein LOC119687793 [Teleopsis dalmanni]|uniref:uncharacterized protein LOC119687793 n=1 Tax=Teleopsis dalmanni TaxID=139649 RepID=UPI0018CD11CB|nr:uncharacterized protein LOC119687793 [Teleopsis dalmanni]
MSVQWGLKLDYPVQPNPEKFITNFINFVSDDSSQELQEDLLLADEHFYNFLKNQEETDEYALKNALLNLHTFLIDYTVEFFFETPKLFTFIANLFEENKYENIDIVDITEIFHIYLHNFKQGFIMHKKMFCHALRPKENDLPLLLSHEATNSILSISLRRLKDVWLCPTDGANILYELIISCTEVLELLSQPVDRNTQTELYAFAQQIKTHYQCSKDPMMCRIQYLQCQFILQDMAYGFIQCKQNPNLILLDHQLADYHFELHCKRRYQNLLNIYAHVNMSEKCDAFKNYKLHFKNAVAILGGDCQNFSSEMLVYKGPDLVYTLFHIKSTKLCQILLKAVTNCADLYEENYDLKQNAANLLFLLLNEPNEDIKLYSFKYIIYYLISLVLAYKDTNLKIDVNTCKAEANYQIFSIIVSTKILRHIANWYYATSSIEIKTLCIEYLYAAMETEHIFSDYKWVYFSEVFIAVLPLLQCIESSSKAGNRLEEMFDPDSPSFSLTYLLKCNTLFLFSKEQRRRSEALTRIRYLLHNIDTDPAYISNFFEIDELIPNDVCVIPVPINMEDCFRKNQCDFNARLLIDSLKDMKLSLIDPNPTNLKIDEFDELMQNWEECQLFSKEYVVYTLSVIRAALKNCMPDIFDPYIFKTVRLILRMLLCNMEVRNILGSDIEPYVLLLRLLIYYRHHEMIRTYIVACLYVMVTGNYLLVTENTFHLPQIFDTLYIPFNHTLLSWEPLSECESSYQRIFKTKREERTYAKSIVNIAISKSSKSPNIKPTVNDLTQLDISTDLFVTDTEWIIFRSTSIDYCVNENVRVIDRSTDTYTILVHLYRLKMCLQFDSNELAINKETVAYMFNVLSELLFMKPESAYEFDIYLLVIEILNYATQLGYVKVLEGLINIVADEKNRMLALLLTPDIPIRLSYHVCDLFIVLISRISLVKDNRIIPDLFCTLDFMLSDISKGIIRCVYNVLLHLSRFNLHCSDTELQDYCNKYFAYCFHAKYYKQFANPNVRMLFEIILNFVHQMEAPELYFNVCDIKLQNDSLLQYLSGMCSDCDARVRYFSWSLLTQFAKNEDSALAIINELNYFPGGFLSCAISTFLDCTETMNVRYMAGNCFSVLLVNNKIDFKHICNVLNVNRFDEEMFTGLSRFTYEGFKSNHLKKDGRAYISAELIVIVTKIYKTLIDIHKPFAKELIRKPIMSYLCKVVGCTSFKQDEIFYIMCANVCQLYWCCDPAFVDCVLCSDIDWFKAFYSFFHFENVKREIVTIFIEFLMFLWDVNNDVYKQICDEMLKKPSPMITLIVMYMKDESRMQTTALTLLEELLLKSQENKNINKNFAHVLEEQIFLKPNYYKVIFGKEQFKEKSAVPELNLTKGLKLQVGSLLFQCLNGKFEENGRTNLVKEYTEVTLQIIKCLCTLLNISESAQKAAIDLDFVKTIISIFDDFLSENMLGTVEIRRRFMEKKRKAITENMKWIFEILVHWFTSPNAKIVNEEDAAALAELCIKIWPWLFFSIELKITVFRACVCVAARSAAVCREFTNRTCMNVLDKRNTVLSLILDTIRPESLKSKCMCELSIFLIHYGVRVLMNCCILYPETRSFLLRSNIMNIFETFHPLTPKAPVKNTIVVHDWLQFWELYSRYKEGISLRHISALCGVIEKRESIDNKLRLLCLKIVRNICFTSKNRVCFIGHDDFLSIAYSIVLFAASPNQQIKNYEEQLIVIITIAFLAAGGSKYVSILRGTKLMAKVQQLHEILIKLSKNEGKFNSIKYAGELKNNLDNLMLTFN